MPTVHLLIKGKVQGVFYRATAKKIANGLKLTGWIRNTDAGDVEALVTAIREQLNAFISWCHKGPANAEVTVVEIAEEDEIFFKDFEVMRG